ncbi:M48 family metalloprotease [bacterium]|nr:M48 family metalloprotease [bacterium]
MTLNSSELIKQIRFKYDNKGKDKESGIGSLNQLRDGLYQNGLLIEPTSTPGLAAKLDEIFRKFNISRDSVSAFIYPNTELQATCIASGPNECVLTFTSGLINLLEVEEFAFVVGHELGHHILNHCRRSEDTSSADYFMQQRAQEISVDRIGLLAAGDLNASIRALMKISTGLDAKYLKFDTSQFISQIKKVSTLELSRSLNSSHPSMMIRCKALLWFSLGIGKIRFPFEVSEYDIESIDERVQNDLIKFVDAPAREQIEILAKEVKMWSAVLLIMEDHKFDKNEQAKFKDLFGEDSLKKILGFLSAHKKRHYKERFKRKA